MKIVLIGYRACGKSTLGRELSTHLGRGPVTVPFHQPLVVVRLDEFADGPPRFLEILEVVYVQALLLQRPHEPFDDPIALRFPDAGRRGAHSQPAQLSGELPSGSRDPEPPG